MPNPKDNAIAGRRVVVMGLGRFGGGIGVTRWLCENGAKVIVTDLANHEALSTSLSEISDLDLEFCLGGHDPSILDDCDLLVMSPAVDKRKSSFFALARERGIPWTSEMNLFLERCRGRIVGITGSVGKSTTTAMAFEILKQASVDPSWKHGRVWLGGNIGRSLLHDLGDIAESDIVVLELSSFQLEDAASTGFRPDVALVTNLRENHLDRHGDMASYSAAKAEIFRNQSKGDVLLLSNDESLACIAENVDVKAAIKRFGVSSSATIFVKEPRGDSTDIDIELRVPGRHNLMNAAGAIAIARHFGVDSRDAANSLRDFGGLPHRLSFIAEVNGVRYYNDSKATSPEAAQTSIAAFDNKPIAIVGGSEKGSSFEDFGRFLAERVKALICIGATAKAIAACVQRAKSGEHPIVVFAESLQEAVGQAAYIAKRGDTVLLAPGCPSYDAFQNYEERGHCFESAVRTLANANR